MLMGYPPVHPGSLFPHCFPCNLFLPWKEPRDFTLPAASTHMPITIKTCITSIPFGREEGLQHSNYHTSLSARSITVLPI